ncbi:MAG: transglutaminase family protein [Jatrophihabitans sp.]|uniref:transglutaminase family protein n=1 Tax=Jatrophihabitans sp. TaxID=1932789 RepID=UPI003F8077AA
MTARYRLVHRTTYTYDAPVTLSYGRAHLTPRATAHQQVLSSSVDITPGTSERRESTDFHANPTLWFRVDEPHDRLEVTATSELVVDRHDADAAALDAPWEAARDGLGASDEARDHRLPSPLVDPAAAREYVAPSFVSGRPLGAALTELLDRVADDFTYRSGATTVRTTVPEVLAARSGVCQDFAHLVIAGLRSLGLAARYVSGYLETSPPPGRAKLRGADASHAWAAVLVPGAGWIELDPTNRQFVDERYVVAAWGRDYTDVPPLKGVIYTDATRSTLQVGVDLLRLPGE